jgi:hypothetical protein
MATRASMQFYGWLFMVIGVFFALAALAGLSDAI